MELILQSKQCLNAGMQQETSQGREGRRFVELGHFDKHVFKNTRKRGLDEYKGLSFQNRFQKFEGRPPLSPPSCPSVSVAEYASISLNMVLNPLKCMNKLYLTMPGL